MMRKPCGVHSFGVMLNRRKLMTGLGAGVIAVGFDAMTRSWAVADTGTGFDRVPPLDGTLLVDDTTRTRDSQDLGRYVTRKPLAVLRPGSVRDIETMVRFSRRHGIEVATRGRAHSTHGQGLTAGL